ncbi:MAG TPA: hypothetical protein VIY48_02745 [Candidatus Paceibacterota bacterium]
MQFCDEHWASLREAIDERGLSHLVRDPSESAVLVKEVEDVWELTDPTTIKTFDPIMAAHWAIVANVLNSVGMEMFFLNEDGTERCPLCFMAEVHAECCVDEECTITSFDDWIDSAADESLITWEELKAKERGDVRVIQ